MKSKTKTFFLSFSIVTFLFLVEIVYLHNHTMQHKNVDTTNDIMKQIALPHLAISANDLKLKEKSYSNIFELLSHDGELPSSSKMSFVY